MRFFLTIISLWVSQSLSVIFTDDEAVSQHQKVRYIAPWTRICPRVTHPECYSVEGAQWPVVKDIDSWVRKYHPPHPVHRVATALKKKDINIPA